MYVAGSLGMQTGQTYGMPVAYDYQTDFWTPDNRDAQYPRLMANTALNQNNNYASSDFWLINGAYLRMKDFQFGYDFKYSLLKNVSWLTRCKTVSYTHLRAHETGRNLVCRLLLEKKKKKKT